MPDILQVVVFRESNDERTTAVLRCPATQTVYNGDTLRNALIRALTSWFRETEAGRQALAASSEDYNVGDLAVDYTDESLLPYLKREGVSNLEIETYSSGETTWSYDQHLFNGPPVEAAPVAFVCADCGTVNDEGDLDQPEPDDPVPPETRFCPDCGSGRVQPVAEDDAPEDL